MSLLAVVSVVMGIGLWVAARHRSRATASMAADGVQEAEIVVRGRYRPDTVALRAGVPTRLLFNRQEDTPCSERVIFFGLKQEQRLAPFATTAVQFIPSDSGEFLFTCAMGMYQGRLLVRQAEERTGSYSGLVPRWFRPARTEHIEQR